jgi:hypothetical protein
MRLNDDIYNTVKDLPDREERRGVLTAMMQARENRRVLEFDKRTWDMRRISMDELDDIYKILVMDLLEKELMGELDEEGNEV